MLKLVDLKKKQEIALAKNTKEWVPILTMLEEPKEPKEKYRFQLNESMVKLLGYGEITANTKIAVAKDEEGIYYLINPEKETVNEGESSLVEDCKPAILTKQYTFSSMSKYLDIKKSFTNIFCTKVAVDGGSEDFKVLTPQTFTGFRITNNEEFNSVGLKVVQLSWENDLDSFKQKFPQGTKFEIAPTVVKEEDGLITKEILENANKTK